MPESLNAPMGISPSVPKQKEKKQKQSTLLMNYYGVLFLGMAGAFLLAGWTLLRPQLQNYKLVLAQVDSRQALLGGERNYLQSLEQSIAAAEKIPEETLQDIEEALPSEPGVPELIVRLSRLAEAHNIVLSNIQFSAPTNAADVNQNATEQGNLVQVVGVNMNLASPSYAATRRYLDAVERNLRLFDVETLSVSPGQGEDGQSYSVQLRTYVLPPTMRP